MTNSAKPNKVVVPHWWKIFFTWSFAFHITSVFLTFIEQILPFMGLLESTMSGDTYAVSMFVLNGLGVLSRFIKQRSLWEYPDDEQAKLAKPSTINSEAS